MVRNKLKVLTDKTKNENGLSISYADIYSFDFLPDNIKAHDSEGIEESIYKFGFVEPILVNQITNRDISGNGRLKTLRRLFEENKPCPKGIVEKVTGFEQQGNNQPVEHKNWFAPVVLLQIPEEEESTLAIKLNRTNEKGGIDAQKAFEVLMKLRETSPERFALTGYDVNALDHIRMLAKFRDQLDEVNDEKQNPGQSSAEGEEKENIAVTLNKKWNVQPGDIWQLGNHKIICGDSKDLETYYKLFDCPTKIRFVFSSPPYDNQRTYELEGKLDWTDLMNNVMKNIINFAEAPCDIIFNLGLIYDGEVKFYWNDWLDYCKNELKNPLYGLYIWDKLTGMPGEWNGRLSPAHEFFLHFSIGKQSANKWIEKTDASIVRGPKKTNHRQKDGGFKALSSPETLEQKYKVPDSVIRMQKEVTRGIHTEGHPATFPVQLPEFMIQTYSQIGDIILEPFLGSGTTLIACQNTSRIGYCIEYSPNYVALAIERFQRAFEGVEIKKL